MRIQKIAGHRILVAETLELPGVVHGFGTSDLGSSARAARGRIKKSFPEISAVHTASQVHGVRHIAVSPEDTERRTRRRRADIIVTDRPGLAAAARTADCTPVLIADPVRRVAAAVHAGWKGTALRGPERAVRVLAREYGSSPADLRAAIGPCIGPCHYQVDAPVIQAIRRGLGERAGECLAPDGPEHARLDLAAANRIVLTEAGVPEEAIETAGLCTYCHDELFFSYRRQGKGVPSLYHFVCFKEDG